MPVISRMVRALLPVDSGLAHPMVNTQQARAPTIAALAEGTALGELPSPDTSGTYKQCDDTRFTEQATCGIRTSSKP